MSEKTPNRFFAALRQREMGVVNWLLHPIPDQEAAERALIYGQRAGLFAVMLRVVYALYPAGEVLPEEYDFAILAVPENLVLLAIYLYVFVDGFRRWVPTLCAAALFAADTAGLLGEPEGGVTLLRVVLGLYVLRCFVIGVRAGRRLGGESPK